MALSRVKTWIAGEVLTASDLNGEFNNILDNLSFALSTQFANGTLANPSLAFVNDTDTGGYLAGVNQFALVAGGATAFVLTRAASAGTAFALFSRGISDSDRFYPALTFGGQDDGVTAISAGTLDLVASGRRAFQASSYVNATNFLRAVAAQASQPPVLEAAGGDTNAALLLRGKGTGYVTASNFVLENFVATQSPTITGRTYWHTAENAVHISAGTLMARVPALTEIQEGELVGITNPSGVDGATVFSRIQLGTGLTLTGTGLSAEVAPVGQPSRLVYETSTKLNLASGYVPLKVSGTWERREIDTAVELLAPAVSSNTLYYIYAYDSSGVTTLEASTTGHVSATLHGVRVKSGDESRTLVGAAFAGTGGAFVSNLRQRLVSSWFNRIVQVASGEFSTDRNTTSATFVEINSEIRNEFFTWSDETVFVFLGGSMAPASPGSGTMAVGFDSATVQEGPAVHVDRVSGGGIYQSAGVTYAKRAGITEGTHFTTVLGLSIGGTTTSFISNLGPGEVQTVLSTAVH